MGVQQRARAVEHPYSGPLATKSKKKWRAGLVGGFAVGNTACNQKLKKACRRRGGSPLCAENKNRPPSMGVQQRARAVEHPYSGPLATKSKNKMACRPRRRVRSGNTAQPPIARARRNWSFVPGVGTFGKCPGLGILTTCPSWGCWRKPRVGGVDKIPELGILAKAPSWGF